MNTIRDMLGELLILCSSFIYDLTSGWLSGEEEAPECMEKDQGRGYRAMGLEALVMKKVMPMTAVI